MSYNPDVAPGDPATVRTAGPVTITKLSVSQMHNNVYLLTDTSTNSSLLIDAAADAPAIVTMLDDRPVDHVVTTHQHWDHHRALPDIVAATGARTYAGVDDAAALPVPIDVPLRHGDVITVGSQKIDVLVLRGHTPGSVALAWTDDADVTHLFTGDALFPGGLGQTSNPGQNFDQLYDDVVTRVFDVYSDSTIVYPGHGGDTTLGAERPQLSEWRARGW